MGRFSLWDEENIFKLIVVMVIQLCKYTTKMNLIFETGDFMVYTSYLNKAVKNVGRKKCYQKMESGNIFSIVT